MTPVKFYIATRLENAGQAREVAEALKAAGHLHTYDWTVHGSVQLERLEEVSMLEAKGVMDADIVIALLPGGRGTHVEIGIGLGASKPVLLCAEQEDTFTGPDVCAFYRHYQTMHVIGSPKEWIREALGFAMRTSVLKGAIAIWQRNKAGQS